MTQEQAAVSEGESLDDKALAIAARLMGEHRLSGTPELDAPIGQGGLGFDSMGRLELYAAIEKECAVKIPEKYWGGRLVRDLRELVKVAVAA